MSDTATELRTAAKTIRTWVADEPPAGWAPTAIAAFGPAVADWLDHAADTYVVGRIHGTSLVICEACCQEDPCKHIEPALAVARALNPAV